MITAPLLNVTSKPTVQNALTFHRARLFTVSRVPFERRQLRNKVGLPREPARLLKVSPVGKGALQLREAPKE